MTDEEIIEMAIEAEFVSHGKPSEEESELFVCVDKDIYKFAKLVAAKALIQEKALQALHSENERLGLYKDTYAEQEPMAYLCENAVGHKYFRWKKPSSTYKPIALYTTPPQRKPLTDEQIDEEFKLYASKFDTSSDKWLDMGADDYFKAGFKAAHGIKENKHDKR